VVDRTTGPVGGEIGLRTLYARHQTPLHEESLLEELLSDLAATGLGHEDDPGTTM
jgi:hypothetical protein